MYRFIFAVLILCWCSAASAQDGYTVLIAQSDSLVITVPPEWQHNPMRWDSEDFRFTSSDFTIFIYNLNQHLLKNDLINPTDFDAALKLFPFQRTAHGKRSLTPAGWQHETQRIEYDGVEFIVSDYRHTQTPALELLRILDNGIMVLAQVEFEEPNYTDLDPIYEALASIRMTEPGEFTCKLADFGDVPVYEAADLTSSEISPDAETAVINYFFTTDDGWFSLEGGGFVRTDDIARETFSTSDCLRVPFEGEKIEPIDPETVVLSENLYIPSGYVVRYPQDGGWHVDHEVEITDPVPWDRRGGVTIQNYMYQARFNVYYPSLLEHWQDTLDLDNPLEADCEVEKHYEDIESDGQPMVRYSTFKSCPSGVYNHTYLAFVADPDTLVVADIMPIFPHRPPSRDTQLIERILLTTEKSVVGDVICQSSTREETDLYAEPMTTDNPLETLPANQEIEIQAYARTEENVWSAQLTSGLWTPIEKVTYGEQCGLLPIFVVEGQ